MTTIYNENVTGVILAGGKARRMGGCDKGLIEINDQPMIKYVIDALKPQVKDILINANRNTEQYENFGYAVIADQLEDYQGPLAGIAAAMDAAKTSYICTCPCDGPFVAKDLVSHLYSAFDSEVEIAVAHDGNRMQPVYALIDCNLKNSLINYLNRGERKIDKWFNQHKCIEVDFSAKQDCFININTLDDKTAIACKLSNQHATN